MKHFTLSGGIGTELSVSDFQTMIDDAMGDEITLDFSSVGGYVSDGFEIYNMIRDYPGRKKVVLNGYVASIASYISMAFDEVEARDNTAFMIHNAFGGVFGDYKELERYSDHLKNLTDLIANAYVGKTKRKKEFILDLMDDETWLYGKEILDNGFADSIRETEEDDNKEDAVARASKVFNTFNFPVKSNDMERAVAMAVTDKGIFPYVKAKNLIKNGSFDKEAKNKGNQPIQDGVVYRSVLRRLVSNATGENKDQIAELISMIDKQGDKTVNKQEILNALSNLFKNNEANVSEVMTAIGKEDNLVTEEQRNAASIVAEFNKLGVEDPVKEFNEMRGIINDTEKTRIENKLKDEFDKDGKGEENTLFIYAKRILGEKNMGELDAAIAEFKEDPIAKKLALENADVLNESNEIGFSESAKNKAQAYANGAAVKL